MLVGWNLEVIEINKSFLIFIFQMNLGALAQRENFGIFKFGVRVENIYEKLTSNVP